MPHDLVVELPRFERQATLLPETFNAETRTLDVVWTTGARVKRSSFWSGETWLEELSLADGAVDLARLNDGAPVLDSHKAWGVRNILGGVVPGSARILPGERPNGIAQVRLSQRDEIADVVRDIQDGIIRNLSVGYEVDEFQEVDGDARRKAKEPPLMRAVRWRPCELSFVAVGADAGAQTRAAQLDLAELQRAAAVTHPCRVRLDQTPRRTTMPDPTDPQKRERPEDQPPPPPPPDPETHDKPDDADDKERDAAASGDAQAAAARAIATERTRISEIRRAVRQVDLSEDFADTLVETGVPLDHARKRIFDELGKRQPRVTATISHRDGGATLRAGMENALLYRLNPAKFPLTPEGREWHGCHLMDFARGVLEGQGIRTRGLPRIELAGIALGLRQPSGYLTTSDFPAMLANLAVATLAAAYQYAPKTFPPWTRQTTLPDFRITNRVALGSAPRLLEVPEHGEYTRGPLLPGAGNNIQLKTWGRILAFTRQALINDDLGIFERIPQMFGASAAQMESDAIYGILMANPVMLDGQPLFSAAHGNLAPAAGITVASMTIARNLMRTQKSPDGGFLNLTPLFLIVGPSMEVAALQFTATTVVPTNIDAVVPVALKSLEVIVEPRITDTSWYLAASPALVDTIEYAYLADTPSGPIIETRVGFDIDGTEIKAREDFAAAAIGWQGLVKTPGA
jgi:hypothetical protein